MIDHRKGILSTFASVICFSTVGPVTKLLMLAYPHMHFEWMLQVRMTIAALFFVVYCFIRDRKALKLSGKQFALVVLIGVLGLFGVQYGAMAALQTITIAVTVFVQDTASILVCLFSFFFLKEKLSGDKVAGLIFGAIGMVIIFYTPDAFGQGMAIAGVLWAFSTAFAKVFYVIAVKLSKIPFKAILAYGFSAGAIVSWFFYPLDTIGLFKANIGDLWFITMILLLSVVGTIISFFLYIRAITLTYLSTVGLITMCTPLMALLASYVVLGEMISVKDGIGVAFIFFGIVVMQIRAYFRDRAQRQITPD